MILKDVKPIKQKKMMCGPTSLQIVLKYYDKEYSQKKLKKLLNSSLLMGTGNEIMVEVAKNLGFKAEFKSNSSISEIKKLIFNKIPPIIGWITPKGDDHFSVVNGIDKKFIYIVDPKEDQIRKFNIEDFEKRWLNVYCDNFSNFKKIRTIIKLFINQLINKKHNYKLPLNEKDIIRKGIIIIKSK